jgi:hypothetical protein
MNLTFFINQYFILPIEKKIKKKKKKKKKNDRKKKQDFGFTIVGFNSY